MLNTRHPDSPFRFGWGAANLRWLMLVVVISATACAQVPSPSSVSTSPDDASVAEVERSISVRLSNGLQADRGWVTTVNASPESIVRWTILVTRDEAHQIDEREIAQAIQFRLSVGMLADEGWVRSLQTNPLAVVRSGVLMSAEEAAAFDHRIRTQLDVAPAVQAYGERHADEFAGVSIDPITSAIVAKFTSHLEEHRQAIVSLMAPGVATVDVREARWTTMQLDAFNAKIWTPASLAWFEHLGVNLLGGGSRVVENDVAVRVAIPAPDDDVAAQIVARFHGEDWLTVEVMVNPSLNLQFGALEIKVADMAGRPVVGVVCEVVPDVQGAAGDDTVRDSDASGTCLWERIHATEYRIDIWGRFRQDLLGSARVRVPVAKTGTMTVVVQSP